MDVVLEVVPLLANLFDWNCVQRGISIPLYVWSIACCCSYYIEIDIIEIGLFLLMYFHLFNIAFLISVFLFYKAVWVEDI